MDYSKMTTDHLRALAANGMLSADPVAKWRADLARMELHRRPVEARPASAADLRRLADEKAARDSADRLRRARRECLRTLAEANGLPVVDLFALLRGE